MLNKGPHILDAVSTLDDILARVGAHHYKKTALMRPLHSWQTPHDHGHSPRPTPAVPSSAPRSCL
jgi:pyruvate kinase